MSSPLLSIVVPVYNSAETLGTLHTELTQALNGEPFELILVDDGSRDESWNAILKLHHLDREHVRGIRLGRNYGQHNAIVCGFGFAQGEVVLTMDDDLQHPPSEIPKLLETFRSSGADVVYGIPKDKRHGTLRNAGSSFVQKSSRLIGGNTGEGSSFRLMKKTIADLIYSHRHQSHLFIDEILHWYTQQIATVPVEHHDRRAGKSGYTFFRLFTMYADILINYTAIPLKVMTWGGLLTSVATFILGIYFIHQKIVHGSKPGFTATIVAVLFGTSLLMFCMGIIGQYLYKLYHLQNRRPPWSVAQTT